MSLKYPQSIFNIFLYHIYSKTYSYSWGYQLKSYTVAILENILRVLSVAGEWSKQGKANSVSFLLESSVWGRGRFYLNLRWIPFSSRSGGQRAAHSWGNSLYARLWGSNKYKTMVKLCALAQDEDEVKPPQFQLFFPFLLWNTKHRLSLFPERSGHKDVCPLRISRVLLKSTLRFDFMSWHEETNLAINSLDFRQFGVLFIIIFAYDLTKLWAIGKELQKIVHAWRRRRRRVSPSIQWDQEQE